MPDDNKLRDHVFDGISEYDNDLPGWWLKLLWITVAWAACYVLWHVGGAHLGPAAWLDEQNAAMAAQAKDTTGPLTEGVLRVLSHEEPRKVHGKELFAKMLCATCHGSDATGVIGPNLRDDFWIYGSDMEAIVEGIANGRANGMMPAQGKNLSSQEIIDLAVFVAALNRESKASGKPPDAAREKNQPITY
jgi:cytochrome c oxidase cbb3-type subunit 3